MSDYEVVKRIMDLKNRSEEDKLYYILVFLNHWITEDDLDWLWE